MTKYLSILIILTTSLTFGQISDSIYSFRNLSKKQELSIEKRIIYAKKALDLSISKGQDSTILKSSKTLSSLYVTNKDFEALNKINHKNIFLAKKLKDTASIANAYYNLGYSYKKISKVDSSYYYYFQATELYDKLKDYQNKAAVLLNMSNIQESERDYIGAQNNAIKAINLLDKLPKSQYNLDTLWSLYNLIGIVSGELQQYDKSLDYHEKAIKISAKIEDNYFYKVYSKVNIASTYRKEGSYGIAIKKYSEILDDKRLLNEDPSSYAYVLNDLGYTKFLNKEASKTRVEKLFRKAFNLSDSIMDSNIKMSTSINFADYFNEENQIDSALHYSTIAYDIGKELKHNKTVLRSLLLKSKIEKGESSKKYLYEHINLNDSLVLAERSIRNKFMRIDFETEEIKQENIQVSKQNLWLIITSIVLLFTLFFLYLIKNHKEKNKELQLERQQQEANQEIYNLLLTQQDKIDEVRSLEKNRISKDIHDGVLGKLFGVRLSLDSLNLSSTPEAVDKRSNYINELKNIEEEIRKVSHELNSDFIKESGYLDILRTLVDTQMIAYGIDYHYNADPNINWETLNNKIKIHLYRILQETMQNTYKHAKAKKVEILFNTEQNGLSLSISDNGVGFDLQKAKKGIGLKNIQSRIKEINGRLAIQSSKEQGTTIKINVPII